MWSNRFILQSEAKGIKWFGGVTAQVMVGERKCMWSSAVHWAFAMQIYFENNDSVITTQWAVQQNTLGGGTHSRRRSIRTPEDVWQLSSLQGVLLESILLLWKC